MNAEDVGLDCEYYHLRSLQHYCTIVSITSNNDHQIVMLSPGQDELQGRSKHKMEVQHARRELQCTLRDNYH